MIAHISEALDMLILRNAQQEGRQTAAREVYLDSLLREQPPEGGAAGLVAAMDELELNAQDLKSDANVAEAVRRFQGELVGGMADLHAARAAAQNANREMENLPFGDPAFAEFRRRAAFAENAVAQRERIVEVLRLSMKSCVARAPRLFPEGVVPLDAFAPRTPLATVETGTNAQDPQQNTEEGEPMGAVISDMEPDPTPPAVGHAEMVADEQADAAAASEPDKTTETGDVVAAVPGYSG
jgi:hypothetical protein